MSISTFLRHLALVLLIILAWSPSAFCGEIHDAAKAGDLVKVKELLKDHPELVFSKNNEFGLTPLFNAAGYDHKDVAELLIANKADVNARNKYGETPLHDVAVENHTKVVELLRQHGGHE